MSTTQTGIEITLCSECGVRHPVTRTHCETCGAASLFPHDVHSSSAVDWREPRRVGTYAERLAYWRERLAIAEHIGRPAHIAHVKERVDAAEAKMRREQEESR